MEGNEIVEEMEALQAIFMDEFTDVSKDPICFMIKLTGIDVDLKGVLSLKTTIPQDYPNVPPVIEIPMRSKILTQSQYTNLLTHINDSAKDLVGCAMIYSLVDIAKEWLNANITEAVGDINEVKIEEENVSQPVDLIEPPIVGGKWEYVIGLVGKPSAGKSTFFNAARMHNQAKVGAHPFTTIDPNMGRAFYTIPCPCQSNGKQCTPAFGHNHKKERCVPVLLKDVAGLVPGACDGLGRGNRFLNDLCDADVLMHVIDVSGCTNEKGEETIGYDPSLDVVWLRDEIHRWIYDNVKAKWESILRKPLKLIDMFTGYHVNRATIVTAIRNAGIGPKDLSNIGNWKNNELKTIVDHFMKIRFPIFLVLNKCDTEDAVKNIERIQSQFPDIPCLPVSAKLECFLQQTNNIEYEPGGDTFKVIGDLDAQETKTLEQAHTLIKKFNSTNVHQALSEAVKMRSPTYAFPVLDLDTLGSIDIYRGEAPGFQRDCISLKPGTTVEELFTALSYPPNTLLAGDFIRAECVDSDGKKRIMKKDENINQDNCVLKIFTTRKAPQVKSREVPGRSHTSNYFT